MAVNLSSLAHANSVSIFVADPVTRALLKFLLTRTTIPSERHVRLDLTHNVGVTKPYTATRNPVEKIVADNIYQEPESVTVTGQLTATPLGTIAAQLGLFGQFIRRDLRELEKLRKFANKREPVLLITPARPYPSMAMEIIGEQHAGDHKVELTLTFTEIEVVNPLAVGGIIDTLQVVNGGGSEAGLGGQPTQTVTEPAGVAGGVGA